MTELVIAALGLACCVYLASASAKLYRRSAYTSFREGLAGTGLISDRLLPAAAAALAACEVLVAGGVATAAVLTAAGVASAPAVTTAALALAVTLTGILTAGVAVILQRGTRARCACFGSATDSPLGRSHLVRNLTLLTVLVGALICAARGPGQAAAGEAAVAMITGAVAGLLLTRLDDLIALFAPVSRGSV